ncbi:MAG: SPOR domain-containing protein [Limnohabitans sp.]|jgi:cell division protein FtsN|nr:SPOR domain-containing protein [Limnohabitans sp.]MDP4733848.1 SPOR domain-containing protein [Limnohabitans sp.]MDP4771910.1 SPOR domain-containing protein [Limnohabitans sp.]
MTLKKQGGGTFLGFIIGLVLGLGVALAVAIYVTKVPTPFSNKNQPRTSAQDVQETEKNKNWNPNSVLQPKAPAETPAPPDASAPAASPQLSEKPTDKPSAPPRPAVTADPLGDLAKAKSGLNSPAAPADSSDRFDYVVQVGAYRTSADADAQKAKLALLGLDAKVSERDQAGRVVYRVRLGPFSDKSAAERTRALLESNGIDNTLVRVQR